jgi:sec-independent protein translocase protein TatB
MFGLGWGEMLVVGVVALIIIGPKDLPHVFRAVGEFTGKARGMAREFSRAMNDAARDSGVNDISDTLRTVSNPRSYGVDKIKEATGMTKGPETTKLSEERQAAKEKLSDAMANAATKRQAKEAEAAAAASKDASAKDTTG